MVWPAIIAGAATLLGQSSANAANRRLAVRQEQFQERMSSTAHVREVADLRKAGLNPILSANKGASSPQGALPTQQNIASSAKEIAMLTANIALTEQQARATSLKADIDGPVAAIARKATPAVDHGINSATDVIRGIRVHPDSKVTGWKELEKKKINQRPIASYSPALPYPATLGKYQPKISHSDRTNSAAMNKFADDTEKYFKKTKKRKSRKGPKTSGFKTRHQQKNFQIWPVIF